MTMRTIENRVRRLERLLCVESDTHNLKKIKNAIYRDRDVKRLTSRVLKDDGAWGHFNDLLNALRNAHPSIISVSTQNSPRYPGGYEWKDGKMMAKHKELIIDTEYGPINGIIQCFGAGSVEDPLDSYDMVLQLW